MARKSFTVPTQDSLDRQLRKILFRGVGALIVVVILVWVLLGRSNDIELDPAYEAQVNRLSETRENLESLIQFIDQQALTIAEREKILGQLADESDALSKVVETDREAVEAVLEAFKAKQRREIWIDRIIAFWIGFFSSLGAAPIWWWWSSRKSKDPANKRGDL